MSTTTVEVLARVLDEDAVLEITSHSAADGSARRKDAAIGTNSGAMASFGDDEVIVIRKIKAPAAQGVN